MLTTELETVDDFEPDPRLTAKAAAPAATATTTASPIHFLPIRDPILAVVGVMPGERSTVADGRAAGGPAAGGSAEGGSAERSADGSAGAAGTDAATGVAPFSLMYSKEIMPARA